MFRVLIKDDDGTTVVNETVPVTPGEKFDESFGPLEPSTHYTATVTPLSNGTEGMPREEEFTTGELAAALVPVMCRAPPTAMNNVFRSAIADRCGT